VKSKIIKYFLYSTIIIHVSFYSDVGFSEAKESLYRAVVAGGPNADPSIGKMWHEGFDQEYPHQLCEGLADYFTVEYPNGDAGCNATIENDIFREAPWQYLSNDMVDYDVLKRWFVAGSLKKNNKYPEEKYLKDWEVLKPRIVKLSQTKSVLAVGDLLSKLDGDFVQAPVKVYRLAIRDCNELAHTTFGAKYLYFSFSQSDPDPANMFYGIYDVFQYQSNLYGYQWIPRTVAPKGKEFGYYYDITWLATFNPQNINFYTSPVCMIKPKK
jgi:hypothetical protein